MRETATDRLADVICVIQFGHKTGILSIERGRDSTFEEAIITFVHGQITQASAGSREGIEALNWLNTWSECLFTFITPPADNTVPLQRSFDMPPATRNGAVTGPLQGSMFNRGIPYRIKPFDEAILLLEYRGLTRLHRRLLILIDGQRSLSDLVRLTGRRTEEVVEQLDDLEGIGVIHQ